MGKKTLRMIEFQKPVYIVDTVFYIEKEAEKSWAE